MKLVSRVTLSLAAAATLGLGWAATCEAAIKARALGAWVNVPEYGAPNRFVCDAGWLPVTGGHQSATALAYVAGTALTMDEGTATVSSDDDCEGDDDFARVQLGYTVLMPGYVSETSFTTLNDDDGDDCCNPDDDDFTPAVFQDLMFAGEPVVVTGLPNQEIVIAGIGRLVINEIVRDDDDDCDDDDFTVNALHLFPESGGEIIVGSTIYDDDEDCCETKNLPRSWGQLKVLYR